MDTNNDSARQRLPKQQLSKGMEHMRNVVTVQDTPPATDPAPLTDSTEDVLGTAAYGVPASFQPVRKPATEASKMNDQKRTDPFKFGSRFLEEGDDIFAHNAWDHVETDEAYKAFILEQAEFQRSAPVSDFDKKRFNDAPEKFWDKFYSNNRANFFKDRKWLKQEFPALAECTSAPEDGREEGGSKKRRMNTILEIGAGAGNTAFPLLKDNANPDLMIHACDFSSKAVQLIKSSAYYDPKHITASQWDMASKALPEGVEPGSVDVVVLVFAFSALAPSQWKQAVRNVWKVLRPGGEVCFRDYGRGDLAQVRFKKGRLLGDNFYARGDGTRVYFFEEEELRTIWGEGFKGLDIEAEDGREASEINADEETESMIFEIESLGTDRRLLVNRQKQLKMYRCWMQGHFRKLETLVNTGKDNSNPDKANNT